MRCLPGLTAALHEIHSGVDKVVYNPVYKNRKCPIKADLHLIA